MLEIPLDPDLPPIRLKDWASVEKWLAKEDEAWNWLSPASGATNPASVGEIVQERLRWFRQSLQNFGRENRSIEDLQSAVHQVFNPKVGPVFPSESSVGSMVLELRESCGDDGAAAAYAFLLGRFALGNANGPNQLRAIMLVGFPPFEDAVSLSVRLSKERARVRDLNRSVLNELRDFESRREIEWNSLLKRSSALGLKQLRSLRDNWKSQQASLNTDQTNSIDEINDIKSAYEEKMQLLGPVRYWTNKARSHGVSESLIRN